MKKPLFSCKPCASSKRKFPKICPGYIAAAITAIALVYMQWMQ